MISRCPICRSDEAAQVRTKADIVKCSGCDLVYLRTRPSVRELEAHYQKYASNPGSHMKLPSTIEQIKTSGLRRPDFLKEVGEFAGSHKGRMLDVGCGWGAFLVNARDQGFEVEGVEICAEMADFAQRFLGIKTHKTQLETCPLNGASFRFVTLLHSLEHLPSQAHALDFIHHILEPGGFIAGIVPNFGSFCSEELRDAWEWLDPSMHYVQFTPGSLTKCLWTCGFNVLRMYTTTGDFNKATIAALLRKTVPITPEDKLSDGIAALNDLGKGEEIRFFAHAL